MAEPLPINIVIANTDFTSEVRYLTAIAYRNTNTVLGSGYNLQWLTNNITTTGFTLSVAYISAGNINASRDTENISYNVSNFILDIPGRYSFINTSAPITTNIYSNKTLSKIFPPLSTVLTQNASSVQVEFSANYSSTNYAPTNISISAVRFDNEPFIRSLTATIMQDIGGGIKVPALGVTNVRWNFTNAVWAKKTDGTTYVSGNLQPVSDIGTMIFYTSATEYNYRTTNYTLCSQIISAFTAATNQTTNYNLQFDTFPRINLNLFANYESTSNWPYFYRQTNTLPFAATLSSNASPVFFTTSFTTLSYQGWYTTSDSSTKLTQLQPTISFSRSNPTVKSVTVYLSANILPGSQASWFTPHIFTKTLSARFVSSFPIADFRGFPGTYFDNDFNLIQLNENNNTVFPGMFFYGEGHTDFIFLKPTIRENINQYIWKINNSTTQYSLSSIVNGFRTSSLNQPLTSVYLQVNSSPNTGLRIPVSLQVINNNFTENEPLFFYDDITGIKKYYPYYYSTSDANNPNIENSANTNQKQSIHVLTYNTIPYTFSPGMCALEILNANGTPRSFKSVFSIYGDFSTPEIEEAGPCYDKYGFLWKWSTFTECSGTTITSNWWLSGGKTFISCLPQYQGSTLGTWTSLSCNSQFAKRWRNEGAPTILPAPFVCTTPGVITWTLSSSSVWPQTYTLRTSSTTEFDFTLRAKDYGKQLFTTSIYTPTFIKVKAQLPVSCQINAISPYTGTNDWVPKTRDLEESFTSQFITTPSLRIYTPNRFVLTGTPVQYENLITQKQLITALAINFGENPNYNLYLTGNNILRSHFTIPTYNITGYKSITLTAYTTLRTQPFVQRFNNIIKIIDNYDEISPSEYRIPQTPIELPWPEQPQVGSNDWVTSDNINSCIKKFDDNLNYLLSRTKEYYGPFTERFGWLGFALENNNLPGACLRWTWEDLDCLSSPLFENVTWRKLFNSNDPTEDENEYSTCNTWEKHLIESVTPTPTGLFLNQCDNDVWWHVNIPLLDTSYNSITSSFAQPRCTYTGITSRKNMLYTSQKTQIKLLSSDYSATYYDNYITFNGAQEFANIKDISLDSKNKIYILDGTLNQVASYIYNPQAQDQKWLLFTTWGGYGSIKSRNKFLNPNDLHIDQLDNIWVADTGNSCIKHYSNTGTWINTITLNEFLSTSPISMAVDSQKNVHVLTQEQIYIFSYTGELLQTYNFKPYTSATPVKIISSYNREILYVLFETAVLKFFRNGIYSGTIIQENEGITNITGGYHDEYRNLLITAEDKIIKYCDLMTINLRRGIVPSTYLPLSAMTIHENEYVQNWVYIKTFQRLWDNIELYRNLLVYSNEPCKKYVPPIHSKDKIIIGQNEIVTAATVNRILQYLWENLITLLNYYKTDCKP